MRQEHEISRRTFLGLSAAAVAVAALSPDGAREAVASAPMPWPGRRRNEYRVFSEGRIGRLRTTNRLVRSATAESASPDGRINADGLGIYERLARGGAGLIITGHIVALPGGDVHGNQTHLDDDRYIEAARRIADTVHGNGAAKVVAQLSHGGPNSMVDPVAPSDPSARRDGRTPRVLSAGEIDDVVTRFAATIVRAREAGFDAVEIHAAHSFLLHSFLSATTNRREDEYGGSAARRASIIAKIVAAARRQVGPDYPLLVKVSCNDQGEDEPGLAAFAELAGEIEKAGVDAINVSGRNPARTGIDRPEQEAYFLPFAERARVRVPVVLTGGNRSIDRMEAILRQGKVDFFALARPLIREPDLPQRFLEGSSTVAACISCNGCLRELGRTTTHCVQVTA